LRFISTFSMMASMTMSQSARSCMLSVPGQMRLRLGLLLGSQTALGRTALHHTRERLLDAGESLVEEFLFLFEHHHIETRGRRNLRDARAHQTTTQYSDFLYIHVCDFPLRINLICHPE
jgi:hypothetical protein